jgi:purine-binding chemotaxis protein CheW
LEIRHLTPVQNGPETVIPGFHSSFFLPQSTFKRRTLPPAPLTPRHRSTFSPNSTLPFQKQFPSSQQYLTFVVGGESYGVPVLNVHEMIRHSETTPVLQMPDYLQGVLNLREKRLPVADLRQNLGFDVAENTEHKSKVVVRVASAEIGLLVDSAEAVMQIASGDIEPTPDFGGGIEAPYMLGVAKVTGAVKILLDIDRVVTATKPD